LVLDAFEAAALRIAEENRRLGIEAPGVHRPPQPRPRQFRSRKKAGASAQL
jgi:hypothetical protein